MLIIGEVSPLARLTILGVVPLNTLYMSVAASIALYLASSAKHQYLIALLPVPLATITLAWSPDLSYGLYKIGNLTFVTLILALLLAVACDRSSPQHVGKVLVTLLGMLLVVAVVHKLRTGFFDRESLFFLNGPIVFGRLMGIAALLSLSLFKRSTGLLLFLAFALAVIWTASKGPIVAMVLTLLLLSLRTLKLKRILITAAGLVCVMYVFYQYRDTLTEEFGLLRVFEVIEAVVNQESVESRSVNVRWRAIVRSIEVIFENPLGVGLGGWQITTQFPLAYPHNFFMEVISEMGIIIGTIFAVPFLLFVFRTNAIFFAPALLMALNQQFSGDILDARYWLIFSWLTLYGKSKSNPRIRKSTFIPSPQPA